MKVITSVTVFQDAVGMRMSATYSEIDETTGRVLSDNRRFDRVIIGQEALDAARALLDCAADSIPEA